MSEAGGTAAPGRRLLVIPFQQEGWPSGPAPEQELVRATWRFRDYRVALFDAVTTIILVYFVAAAFGGAQGPVAERMLAALWPEADREQADDRECDGDLSKTF